MIFIVTKDDPHVSRIYPKILTISPLGQPKSVEIEYNGMNYTLEKAQQKN